MFLDHFSKIKQSSGIIINFSFEAREYSLVCKHISDHKVIDTKGIGAQFLYNEFYHDQKQVVEDLVSKIEKTKNIPR